MEPRDYLALSRRYWKSALGVALLTLAVTAALTFLPPREYTATTQLFLGVPSRSVSELAQGSDFTEQQMNSYARVATSPLVLEPVARQLGLGTAPGVLTETVTAAVPPNTVILELSATDPDPAQAARIANAVGRRFAAVVGTLVPQQGGSAQTVGATVFAAAVPPVSPSSPRLALNLAIGLVAAVLLGLGTALLRFATNPRLRNESDLQGVGGGPVLGVIPLEAAPKGRSAVPLRPGPSAARTESVRRLRTTLRAAAPAGEASSVLVTSAVRGEGKSATALDLALALADAGTRVVLLEANLRHPCLARALGLREGPGLPDLLTGAVALPEVVQAWERSALHVVTAGSSRPDRGELLDTAAMAALVVQLSSAYDTVLIDGPALLDASDSLALSRTAQAVVVVVDVDRTRRRQIVEALDVLVAVDAHLLGLVLNKVSRRTGLTRSTPVPSPPPSAPRVTPSPLDAPAPLSPAPNPAAAP